MGRGIRVSYKKTFPNLKKQISVAIGLFKKQNQFFSPVRTPLFKICLLVLTLTIILIVFLVILGLLDISSPLIQIKEKLIMPVLERIVPVKIIEIE